MFERAKPMMHWLLTRVFVFQIGIILVLIVSVDTLKMKAKMVNFYSPSSAQYLLDLSNGLAEPNPAVLKSYLKYLKVLGRYIGYGPANYGLTAYLYYHLGDVDQAKKYYQMALKIYPEYSNYYYNLALIDFKNKDFDGMVDRIRIALNVDVDKNFSMIYYSRNEMKAFLAEIDSSQEGYQKKLAEDYKDMTFLFVAGLIAQKNKPVALQALQNISKTKFAGEPRFVCLANYLRTSQNKAQHFEADSFEVCQKDLGWVDPKIHQPSEDDPFGVNNLRLKLW